MSNSLYGSPVGGQHGIRRGYDGMRTKRLVDGGDIILKTGASGTGGGGNAGSYGNIRLAEDRGNVGIGAATPLANRTLNIADLLPNVWVVHRVPVLSPNL